MKEANRTDVIKKLKQHGVIAEADFTDEELTTLIEMEDEGIADYELRNHWPDGTPCSVHPFWFLTQEG